MNVPIKSRMTGLYLGVGLMLTGIAGCSMSHAGPTEQLVLVSGTVTLEGKPIEGAIVSFIPTGANGARQGSGVTDSDGQFVMANYQNKEGLPVGPYIVVFSYWRLPDGSAPPSDEPPATSRAVQAIPPHWSDAAKAASHNRVTIRDEGNTDLVFKISKDQSAEPALPRVMMR